MSGLVSVELVPKEYAHLPRVYLITGAKVVGRSPELKVVGANVVYRDRLGETVVQEPEGSILYVSYAIFSEPCIAALLAVKKGAKSVLRGEVSGCPEFEVKNAEVLVDLAKLSKEEKMKLLIDFYNKYGVKLSLRAPPAKRYMKLAAIYYMLHIGKGEIEGEEYVETAQPEKGEAAQKTGEEGGYVVVEKIFVTPEAAEHVRRLLLEAARRGEAYKTPDGKLVLSQRLLEKLIELGAVPA